MEILMIQSRSHMPRLVKNNRTNNKNRYNKSSKSTRKMSVTTSPSSSSSSTTTTAASATGQRDVNVTNKFDPLYNNNNSSLYNFTYYVDNNNGTLFNWNQTNNLYNITNNTDLLFDNDYQMFNNNNNNNNITSTVEPWSGFCKEWTPAQHNLFQTANFFFAAAFLVPGSFKQSVLLVRALLTIGHMFLSSWAGTDVCAPDIMLWNILFVILNLTHTVLLAWRFLPPTLTLELTELYLKVFKPLKVSKKHFKELVKEAHVVNLEKGDIYAVEDVSPADERLSILLKGKLRVTCDDTHLHFITVHQFVDSPEWEANHEQSDDVFQVTITAEEDSVYLCWPRMRLERVLRHRPMLKVIMDCIIGKDITQKLYSLNEHLNGLEDDRQRVKRDAIWAKAHKRSMSMDAVNTGTTGLVRSTAFNTTQRKHSLNSSQTDTLGRIQQQCWVPLVANQFPAISPFMPPRTSPPLAKTLRVPELKSPQRTKSLRRNREVKFQKIK